MSIAKQNRNSKTTMTVIGGGAWGMAIAMHLRNLDFKVEVYEKNSELVEQINTTQSHPAFADTIIPKAINVFSDKNKIKKSELFFIAIPSKYLESGIRDLAPILMQYESSPAILCTKGISMTSGLFLSDILSGHLGEEREIGILSGPNFAVDIAAGKSSISSLAMNDYKKAQKIANSISGRNFGVIANDDMITTQLVGSYKNVMAIFAGILSAIGASDNTRAMQLSMGIAELKLLASKLGGNAMTLLEPCGAGDIYLTCSNKASRNMSFGFKVGTNPSEISEIIANNTKTVEGMTAIKAYQNLAIEYKIDLATINALHKILFENQPLHDTINMLFSSYINKL